MDNEKNQVNLASPATTSEKLENVDSKTKPPERTSKSLITLENVSENHDAAWQDKREDYELRKEILQMGDAIDDATKLEEMMNKLFGVLDETTDILGGADADEDSDTDYDYILSRHNNHQEVILSGDIDDDAFDDAIGTHNVQNDNINCPEIVEETKSFSIAATTKNRSEGKCHELNEFTESLMIVLMLFSLYFLLSSLV